jgi:hypothetical protein
MRWLRTLILFDKGGVVASDDWAKVHQSYVRSINSIDHPRHSGKLTLRRKKKLPKGQWLRNGVGALREQFLTHLCETEGWRKEENVNLGRDRSQPAIRLYPSMEEYREPIVSDFGEFDFVTTGKHGLRVAIEWETGNISSSHRSMNKLSIALSNGIVDAGVLILPSKLLYDHLTDRIGNIGELSGYLAMWEGLKATVSKGLLAITVVEHDELTDDPSFPYLKVGNDGQSQHAPMKV